MSEIISYFLENIKEGKYRVETEDENILIVIHPVIVKVFRKDQKYSFVVNNVISVHTDKPRFGPLCSGNVINSRPAKIKKIEIMEEPKIDVRVDNRLFEILINVTNISIYPEYRDPYGSPCVTVSTVILY
ncbi:hypothetical protein [Sulfurisphaera tokodaii]|uniref:Uncharacterized protein n=2 Tax=Sulfurisphaera tokodaii TaxID=111955 RepID=Q970N8_SULTO|nr:hypothetical protein [Sulfurisphaera tokodaii]BAB66635.1 hypothetical protein STK_15610 [Sulfurisphaera tokodaii str. 7]HII73544.1 hypothetical protein [Sulfurisphaera tokodaii]